MKIPIPHKRLPSRLPLSGLLLALVGLLLLLAACQSPPPETENPTAVPEAPPTAAPTLPPVESGQEGPEVPVEVLAPEWVLVAFGDAANPVVVEPGTRVTANFEADGRVSGSGGCNSYNTSFELDGENISFSPGAVTTMACEIGMDQENAYFAALESATAIEVVDDERLLITYDSGAPYPEQLVYAAEPTLVNTVWVLVSYGSADDPTPSQPQVVTTAIFSLDGTVSGTAGCNQYTAGYSAEDGQMSVDLPAATLMECPTGMEQERAYLAALESAESYRIVGGILEITYANGAAVLRFSAQHLPLENVRWVLASIDGQPLPSEVVAFAVFTPGLEGQENSLNGNAGCNGFFGSYEVEDNQLTVGSLGVTQSTCALPIMEVENNFLAALQGAQAFETLLDRLSISTDSGTLAFRADRAPLEGTLWSLTALGSRENPRPPAEGAAFTATFSRDFGMPSGVMSGETGCNEYSSAYAAGVDDIKVNLPAKTTNECSEGLMEEEQAFFLTLNAATDYRILGDELQILAADLALVFKATAPPAAQGGPLSLLDGTEWWLISNDTIQVVPGTQITALFAINPDGVSGQMSGFSGCNTYTAEITGVFTLTPPTVTQVFCETPEGVMDQETIYLEALRTAWGITVDFGTLLIETAEGQLVYQNSPPSPVEPMPTPEGTLTPEATPVVTPTAEPTVEPTPEGTPEENQPVAIITAPTEGQVNQPLDFDGSASTPQGEIATYAWDFGDGMTAEGSMVQHTYTAAGTYTVTLTVTDNQGGMASSTLELTISEAS